MRLNASSSWQLYVILDRQASGSRDLCDLAAAAIRGGADVIQLRDKTASSTSLAAEARRLLLVTRPAGIPLIINDHLDVAHDVNADGVHLGQDDGPTQEARRVLGPHQLIGRSTHSLAQAQAAAHDGADYIGFGPIFSTPTKPAYASIGTAEIEELTRKISIPVVCIGGIDAKTLPTVSAAGARCVAVVRAVCAAEDPEHAANILKKCLTLFDRAVVSPTV